MTQHDVRIERTCELPLDDGALRPVEADAYVMVILAAIYDRTVEYETWFCGNARAVPKDPTLPLDAGNDYSNVTFVQDGPPVAHAVAPGLNTPVCGSTSRILPHGFLWRDPIPEHWERCPACLTACPLGRANG
jgi:hypothetical protein